MSTSPIVAIRSRPISASEAQYELQNPNQRRSRSSSTMHGATGSVRSTDDTTVTITNTTKLGGARKGAGGAESGIETYSMTCDHVFVPLRNSHAGLYNASQEAIFEALGQPLVANALLGKSSTLVAFGATGTGKTYSLFGTPGAPGLVVRVLGSMLGMLAASATGPAAAASRGSVPAARKDTHGGEVMLSVFEIYNESVRDLLSPGTLDKALKVQVHPWKGVHIEGLTCLQVRSAEEAAVLLRESAVLRTIGTTNANAHSSRGHCVVNIEWRNTNSSSSSSGSGGPSTPSSPSLYSKTTLVDLAGSERLLQTGAAGGIVAIGSRAVAESNLALHRSLSTLAAILKTLCVASEKQYAATGGTRRESVFESASSASAHTSKSGSSSSSSSSMLSFINPQGLQPPLPIRDAQLTTLLRDTFYGRQRLWFLGTISPASIAFHDSLLTLKVCTDARGIRLPSALLAPCNRDPNVALIETLREEIGSIRNRLRELQDPLALTATSGTASGVAALTKPELLQSLVEATEMLQEATESPDDRNARQRALLQSRAKHLAKLRTNRRIPVNTGVPRLHVLNEDLKAISAPPPPTGKASPTSSSSLITQFAASDGVLPVYYLEDGENSIGRATSASVYIPAARETNLQLFHCVVRVNSLQRKVTLVMPSAEDDDGLGDMADVFLNGVRVPLGSPPLLMRHLDRLIFGKLAFRHAQPPSWALLDPSASAAASGGAPLPFSQDPATLEHALLLEQHGRLQVSIAAFDALVEVLGGDLDAAIDATPGIMELKAEQSVLVARLTLEYPLSEKRSGGALLSSAFSSPLASTGGMSVDNALDYDFKFAMAELERGAAVVPQNGGSGSLPTTKSTAPAVAQSPGKQPAVSDKAATSATAALDVDDFFSSLINNAPLPPPTAVASAGAADDLDGFMAPPPPLQEAATTTSSSSLQARKRKGSVRFADDTSPAALPDPSGPGDSAESGGGPTRRTDRADSVVVILPPAAHSGDAWVDGDVDRPETTDSQPDREADDEEEEEGDEHTNEESVHPSGQSRSPNTLLTEDLPTAADFPLTLAEGDASATATALRMMVMEDVQRYYTDVAKSRQWRGQPAAAGSAGGSSAASSAAAGSAGTLAAGGLLDAAQHPQMLPIGDTPFAVKQRIADVDTLFQSTCGQLDFGTSATSSSALSFRQIAALQLDPVHTLNVVHHQQAMVTPPEHILKLRVRKSFFHRGGFFPIAAFASMRFLFYTDDLSVLDSPLTPESAAKAQGPSPSRPSSKAAPSSSSSSDRHIKGSCYLYGASLGRIAVGDDHPFCIQIDPVARRKATKSSKGPTDDNRLVLGFCSSEQREEWFRRLSFAVLPAVSSSLSKYLGPHLPGIVLDYASATYAASQLQASGGGKGSHVVDNSSMLHASFDSARLLREAGGGVGPAGNDKLVCIAGEIESFSIPAHDAANLRAMEHVLKATEKALKKSTLRALLVPDGTASPFAAAVPSSPPGVKAAAAAAAASSAMAQAIEQRAMDVRAWRALSRAAPPPVDKLPTRRLPLRRVARHELLKTYFEVRSKVLHAPPVAAPSQPSAAAAAASPPATSAPLPDWTDATWLVNVFKGTIEMVDVQAGKAYVFYAATELHLLTCPGPNRSTSASGASGMAPQLANGSGDLSAGSTSLATLTATSSDGVSEGVVVQLHFRLHDRDYLYGLRFASLGDRQAFVEAATLCRRSPRLYAPWLLAAHDFTLAAAGGSSPVALAAEGGAACYIPPLLLLGPAPGSPPGQAVLLPRLKELHVDTWIDGEGRESTTVQRVVATLPATGAAAGLSPPSTPKSPSPRAAPASRRRSTAPTAATATTVSMPLSGACSVAVSTQLQEPFTVWLGTFNLSGLPVANPEVIRAWLAKKDDAADAPAAVPSVSDGAKQRPGQPPRPSATTGVGKTASSSSATDGTNADFVVFCFQDIAKRPQRLQMLVTEVLRATHQNVAFALHGRMLLTVFAKVGLGPMLHSGATATTVPLLPSCPIGLERGAIALSVPIGSSLLLFVGIHLPHDLTNDGSGRQMLLPDLLHRVSLALSSTPAAPAPASAGARAGSSEGSASSSSSAGRLQVKHCPFVLADHTYLLGDFGHVSCREDNSSDWRAAAKRGGRATASSSAAPPASTSTTAQQQHPRDDAEEDADGWSHEPENNSNDGSDTRKPPPPAAAAVADATYTIAKLNSAVVAEAEGRALFQQLALDHDALVRLRLVTGTLLVHFAEGSGSGALDWTIVPSYAPTSKVEVGTRKYNLAKEAMPCLSARVFAYSNHAAAVYRRIRADTAKAVATPSSSSANACRPLLDLLPAALRDEVSTGADVCVAQCSVTPALAGDALLMLAETLPVRSICLLPIRRTPARFVASLAYGDWAVAALEAAGSPFAHVLQATKESTSGRCIDVAALCAAVSLDVRSVAFLPPLAASASTGSTVSPLLSAAPSPALGGGRGAAAAASRRGGAGDAFSGGCYAILQVVPLPTFGASGAATSPVCLPLRGTLEPEALPDGRVLFRTPTRHASGGARLPGAAPASPSAKQPTTTLAAAAASGSGLVLPFQLPLLQLVDRCTMLRSRLVVSFVATPDDGSSPLSGDSAQALVASGRLLGSCTLPLACARPAAAARSGDSADGLLLSTALMLGTAVVGEVTVS